MVDILSMATTFHLTHASSSNEKSGILLVCQSFACSRRASATNTLRKIDGNETDVNEKYKLALTDRWRSAKDLKSKADGKKRESGLSLD